MTADSLVPLADLDLPHREALREVYESSFPLALRAPWDEIVAGRPDEDLLALIDYSDPATPPVGLTLVRHLGDDRMSFVRYFVVAPRHRGSGHGSALLAALIDFLRTRGCSVLLLDVEDPQARPAWSAEQRDDMRRIRFYERHGVHRLAVREYAPPDHGQDGEEPSLLLMGSSLRPAGADSPIGPVPRGATLAAAVVAIYRDRYGLAPDHPVVQATLRASGL